MTIYLESEVAARLHRSKRWLMEWLRQNSIDRYGKPLYSMVGRTKRFTGDQIVLIIDEILTQEDRCEPEREEGGWIYFIDGGENIKIGYSRSLDARMKRMNTDCGAGPKLLLALPGTFKTEKILHRHFAALRSRGEWFRKGQELLAYIEERKNIEGNYNGQA